jgi:cytochrome c-type biogenesis protein CcmH/NrfG
MIPMTAKDFYQLGNQHRRNGDYQSAMNAYMEAVALDPDSPAVEALRMLQDIMNYYCKDVYNP